MRSKKQEIAEKLKVLELLEGYERKKNETDRSITQAAKGKSKAKRTEKFLAS